MTKTPTTAGSAHGAPVARPHTVSSARPGQRTHDTAEGIAARYKALTFLMRDALNSRRTTRAQIVTLEAELDAVADFDSTIAALDALAA